MSSFLVAPDQAYVADVQRKELRSGKKILWGDTYHTLDSFIKKCADPLIAAISPVVKRAIVSKCIKETSLRYFEHVKTEASMTSEFTRAITLFRKNGISADELEGDLSDKGSLKEFDLLTVYKGYEAKLASLGLEDEGDLFRSAIANIEGKKLEFLADIEKIEFRGFDAETPGLKKVISSLRDTYPKMVLLQMFGGSFAPLRMTGECCHPEQSEGSPMLTMKKNITFSKFRAVGVECRFIVQKIIELLKSGHAQDEIGLVVSKSSSILPELTRSLLDFGLIGEDAVVKRDGVIADIKRSLGSDGELISLSQMLTNKLKLNHHPFHSATNLAQIDSVFAADFELAEMRSLGVVVDDKIPIFEEALIQREYLDVTKLPFTLLFFEDSCEPAFRTLIIPEVTEGSVPIEGKSSVFFQDKSFSEESVAKYFAELFPNAETVRLRENEKFLRYLNSASDETILTMSEIDLQGKEVSPSHILATIEHTEADHGYIANPLKNEYLATLEERTKRYSSDLEPKITKAGIPADHVFSTSQLETYGKCPYQYYLNRVAKLEPIEEATPEINPKDRGTIIHRVMELFFRGEFNNCLRFLRNEIKFEELEVQIDEHIGTALSESSKALEKTQPAMVEHFKKRSRDIIISAIRTELDLLMNMRFPMSPTKTEWEFGIDNDMFLKIDDERIHGIIDRIDVDEEHGAFAITDYKTGRTESVLSKIRNGEHLQLPLYLKAVSELLYPEMNAVGGFLYSLRTIKKMHGLGKKESRDFYFPKLNSRMFVKDDEWENLMETALGYASKYMRAIRERVFTTETESCRMYCDYNDICKYGKK